MRIPFLIAAALGTITASATFAADKETVRDNNPAPGVVAQPVCCNTTCPVDGKPVSKDVKTTAFRPVAGPKTPDQVVGFCSDDCRTTYEKDPAKYEGDITRQIQHRREVANPKAN